MTLELLDLVPRPYGPYRGARPGALAAASERNMLEIMTSVGLTAQARLMRNGAARAAEGWSAAEDGAYRAARALNLLTQAVQRLARIYDKEPRFVEEREFGEIKVEPRIHVLAEHALFSTDPQAAQTIAATRDGADTRSEKINELILRNRQRADAYLEATVARLREFDPDWLSPGQHAEALDAADAAALAAGMSKPETALLRDKDAAPDPDRVRRQPELDRRDANRKAYQAERQASWAEEEKTQKRVVVLPTPPAPISDVAGPSLPPGTGSAPAEPSPAASRKRGAQAGNVQSLKSGRHTAAARAERAEDAAMYSDIRELCAEIDRFADEEEARAEAEDRAEALIAAGPS